MWAKNSILFFFLLILALCLNQSEAQLSEECFMKIYESIGCGLNLYGELPPSFNDECLNAIKDSLMTSTTPKPTSSSTTTRSSSPPSNSSKLLEDSKAATRTFIGKAAKSSEYPSSAYIRLKNRRGTVTCGAVLISPQHVLTAAHCLKNLEMRDLRVVLSDKRLPENSSNFNVEKKCLHTKIVDSEKNNRHLNDLAVLRLASDIKSVLSSSVVWPACLASKPTNLDEQVYVTGLGSLSRGDNRIIPPVLQVLPVKKTHCNPDLWNRKGGLHCYRANDCETNGTTTHSDHGGGVYALRDKRIHLIGIIHGRRGEHSDDHQDIVDNAIQVTDVYKHRKEIQRLMKEC